MIKINDGDGKTIETAIIIMSAEDRKEGWDYINSRCGGWDAEYSTVTEEDGFEKQYVVFRKYNEQIWFDWTWLFYYMR